MSWSGPKACSSDRIFRGDRNRGSQSHAIRKQSGYSRSAAVAIVAQAAVFGAMHSYQGLKPMIPIVVLGLLFGSWPNGANRCGRE